MSSGIDIVVETTLTAALTRIHPVLGQLTGIPLVVFLLVFLMTLVYLGFYLCQGARVWFQLQWSLHRIARLKRAKTPVTRDSVGSIFNRQPFRHLWEEYADTLHDLRAAGDGARQIGETRATVPAEMYFTREVLVDSRLWDDFFRHLPGVLTGLGIIGTFAGLLNGLKDFDPSTGAAAVAALKPLLGAVSNAFLASAIAISCAMFVVFTSRLTLAACYRKVEQLNHALDSLYSTGAGEEYLSRLVKSSEESDAHAANLKQALVEDMTALLTKLVERQIAAQQQITAKLGSDISAAIVRSLADPMHRIAQAIGALEGSMKQTAANQQTMADQVRRFIAHSESAESARKN